jgi:hypothetical protein
MFAWGDCLSEKEVYEVMEEASGEKLERKYVNPSFFIPLNLSR